MISAIIRGCLLIVLLSGSSTTLHAQSNSYSIKLQNKTILHQTSQHHPLQSIANLIVQSSLYEALLNSPDFIKIQDIAQRLWDNQTGAKHKALYTNRRTRLKTIH